MKCDGHTPAPAPSSHDSVSRRSACAHSAARTCSRHTHTHARACTRVEQHSGWLERFRRPIFSAVSVVPNHKSKNNMSAHAHRKICMRARKVACLPACLTEVLLAQRLGTSAYSGKAEDLTLHREKWPYTHPCYAPQTLPANALTLASTVTPSPAICNARRRRRHPVARRGTSCSANNGQYALPWVSSTTADTICRRSSRRFTLIDLQ
jgi:hypothetical protein